MDEIFGRIPKEALASLNALSRATVRSPLQLGAVSRDSKPSPAQSSVLRRVRRRIAAYGHCPPDMNLREAHQELFKTADIYSEEGGVAVLPFEASRVRLVQGSVTPQDSLRSVPGHMREARAGSSSGTPTS